MSEPIEPHLLPPARPAALDGLPRYARRSFTWAAAEAVSVAVLAVLGVAEEQAWARAAGVLTGVVAVVTIGVTFVCLRQDSMVRSMEGFLAVHAKANRSHADDLFAKAMNELGGGMAHSGATDRIDEIMDRIDDLAEATEQRLKQERTDGYLDGVRERLSGQSHVIGLPGLREA